MPRYRLEQACIELSDLPIASWDKNVGQILVNMERERIIFVVPRVARRKKMLKTCQGHTSDPGLPLNPEIGFKLA